MTKIDGVADLGLFPVLGQPNLNVKISRERAARYGLNAGDITNVVQAARWHIGHHVARGRSSIQRHGSAGA